MVWVEKEVQGKIDNLIFNKVTNKIGMICPTNSILDIVKALGLKVFLVDFKKDLGIDKNVSGMIDYSTELGEPKIFLNEKMSMSRRNFTLAHELGHYILHKPRIQGRFRMDIENYNGDTKQLEEESEANYFAASLLVPKELLLKITNKLSIISDLEEIAEFFGVSNEVILNRLRWLNKN